MSAADTVENTEGPNWLKELEAKREKRVRTRLGHEAGAGAPCLTCADKCPGLDLHFWRKICKNCKCTKESHDVHDDDIYGWAQFQLLGSKPNKIKHKIVLPGKKDEVELDWAPKGHTETIDKYLQTLPVESLPVKGSQAAQDRKQLLQKQIPIHDIDPTLCHELTDTELRKMYDYIEHMKSNSVGVGQVVHLGELQHLGRNNYHYADPGGELISSRYPRGVQTLEPVDYHGGKGVAAELSKQLEGMKMNDPPNYNPQNSGDIRNSVQDPLSIGGIRDIHYPMNATTTKELDAFFDTVPNPMNMTYYIEENSNAGPNWSEEYRDKAKNPWELPHYAASKYNTYLDEQKPTTGISNIKDLAYSTYDPKSIDVINSNYPQKSGGAGSGGPKSLPSLNPAQRTVPIDNQVPKSVKIGAIVDINYGSPDTEEYLQPPPPLPALNWGPPLPSAPPVPIETKTCKRCKKAINDFAILAERSNDYYHSECFKCSACNQNLADMVYFFDHDSGDIYCGRDYAKIRGIPRCKACDELIFVKNYCLAENSTFHLKHFCCFECDEALAGQNYVLEESQPWCVPCFEKLKANYCQGCEMMIKPNEQGANLNGVHFHATEECFCCKICKKPLFEEKLLLRNRKLYCSYECYGKSQ